MLSRRALLHGLGAAWLVGSTSRRAWAIDAAASPAPIVHYLKEQTFSLEAQADITLGDFNLNELEVWLPVPQDYPEQTVRNVTLPPADATLLTSANDAARVARLLQRKKLAANSKITFTVQYAIASRAVAVDRKRLAALPYAAYPAALAPQRWLEPEQQIESTSPKIAEIAGKIKHQNRPAAEVARAVYEWVLSHTEYQLIDGFGGAIYCLEKHHGECGDYSALFTAICRACGVPARIVAGAWADKRSDWHVWAEFLLPTGEWVPVDGSMGDGGGNRDYYFGHREANRVGVAKGADLTIQEKKRDKRTLPFLQTGAFWWRTNRDGLEDRPKPHAEFTLNGRKLS